MTATPNTGPTTRKKLSHEDFLALKKRLSESEDADILEALNIIEGLETYTAFLLSEFNTVYSDYNLEVSRCNQLREKLQFTMSLLRKN